MTSLRGATAAAILLLAGGTLAAPADDLARIFESRGITATFIAESVLRDARWTYNESRSRQRFAPASTFKILNTLVALDAGVANVDNTVFGGNALEMVQTFVAEMDLTFDILLDPENNIESAFQVPGLPMTFVIDRRGRIREKALGAREWDSAAVQARMRKLLEN